MPDRFDASLLAKSQVTPIAGGGARIPARPTRSGVFPYKRADGTVRRELRPEAEVFDAASLASLQDAPVLEGHPAMVRPTNWRELNRGHVSGVPHKDSDGIHVASQLAVFDPTVLGRVDSGELCELSCGYTCDCDETPGVTPDGEKYDAVQRNIRYNHVGIGPKGWGRGGASVSLRLDGGETTDTAWLDDPPAVCHTPNNPPAVPATQPPEVLKMLVKVDGKDFEQGSAEHLAALTARADRLDGELAASKVSLAEATDQKRLDALVKDRVALEIAAKAILPTVKLDGIPSDAVRREVVSKTHPTIKLDGKSAAYVEALFDAAVASGVRADGITSVASALGSARKDAERLDELNAAKLEADIAQKFIPVPAATSASAGKAR
jgi:hypothetical protein